MMLATIMRVYLLRQQMILNMRVLLRWLIYLLTMVMYLMIVIVIVIVMMVLSLSNGDEEDDGFRRIQKLMKLMKMMVEKQSGLEKGANPNSNVPEKIRLVRVFAAQLSTWPINS